MHVPRRMQALTGSVHKAADELTADLGRAPTLTELADRLNIEAEELVEALDASEAYRTASLDQPVGHEDERGARLGELLGREDPGYEQAVDHEVLRGLVGELGERERRILLMRFFRGMTQSEIGEQLGVSQMQVSRLLTKIIARLRKGFG